MTDRKVLLKKKGPTEGSLLREWDNDAYRSLESGVWSLDQARHTLSRPQLRALPCTDKGSTLNGTNAAKGNGRSASADVCSRQTCLETVDAECSAPPLVSGGDWKHSR